MNRQQISTDRCYELSEELREVAQDFAAAWERLNDIVQELGDDNAQVYLVEQLQILIFKDHGFMSRDLSIEQYAEHRCRQQRRG